MANPFHPIARALLREDLNALATAQRDRSELTQTVEHLRESRAQLQAQLGDLSRGWQMLGQGTASGEPARSVSRDLAATARQMYLSSPLIQRGVKVQADYVFGQGITVQAAHDEINKVVQAFQEDADNRAELTEHTQLLAKERELQLDANLFLTFFVNRVDGRIKVGSIPENQIEEVITAPGKAKRPMFYKRVWTETTLNYQTGVESAVTETRYYPDWRYTPKKREGMIGRHRVEWDMPIYHVKTGGFSDWRFGLTEVLAALQWAKDYEKFLKDQARVAEVLSQFTLVSTGNGDKDGVQATAKDVKTSFAKPGSAGLAGSTAGKTAVLGDGKNLTAMKVQGATIDPNESRRLMLQVCAAFGSPETFWGDVSTGNLATAESLDRPTELGFSNRQLFWNAILSNIYSYVLYWAVKAPAGPLRAYGHVEADTSDRDIIRERVVWNSEIDSTVNIDFPLVIVPNRSNRISDIVQASAKLPNGRLIARLLLVALGEDDVDAILDETFDDDGQPKLLPAEPLAGAPWAGQPATRSNTTPQDDNQ